MAIFDRRKKGLVLRDQPLVLERGAYIDPTKAGPYLFEDFIGAFGATLADIGVVNVAQSGTATLAAAPLATAGAPVAGHGGWLCGSVDNVDNEIDTVSLGDAAWLVPSALSAGGVAVAEVGLVVPTALTARMYFFGLTSGITAATTDGALSIVTGITLVDGATGGDAAGFVMSSLATDVDAWYCGAVKATSVGTAYNPTAATYSATPGPAVVDKYTKLRVEVDSDGDCYFYEVIDTGTNDRSQLTARWVQTQDAAITAAEAYLPEFSAASTTTTAVEWELDYIFGAATSA